MITKYMKYLNSVLFYALPLFSCILFSVFDNRINSDSAYASDFTKVLRGVAYVFCLAINICRTNDIKRKLLLSIIPSVIAFFLAIGCYMEIIFLLLSTLFSTAVALGDTYLSAKKNIFHIFIVAISILCRVFIGLFLTLQSLAWERVFPSDFSSGAMIQITRNTPAFIASTYTIILGINLGDYLLNYISNRIINCFKVKNE